VGVPKQILPFWGVAGWDKQISDPLGNRNTFSAPGTSGVILPGNAGIKISISVGVDESQPPNLTVFFFKKISQIFVTFSPKKTVPPKLSSHAVM